MNRDIAVALIAILAVLGLTFGLHATIPEKPLTPSQPFTPAAERGKPVSDSPVIMRVNGEPITEADFQMLVDQMPAEQRAMAAAPIVRQQMADEIVKIKVLEQEARKLGLDKEPKVAGQLGMIEAQVLASEAVKKLVGTATEQELRAEYEKERVNYETVELSHIVVGYEGSQIPPRNGQRLPIPQAMQKANEIASRVRGGANFAETAANESDDTQTSAQGGALGPVPVSALPPEMRATIGGLKPGEVSAPVRTPLGIHIFRAGARQTRKFEELKPELEQRVKQARVQGAIDKAVKAAKIEKDEKFFSAAPPQGGKSQS